MTTCKDLSYHRMRLAAEADQLNPSEPLFQRSSPEKCGRTIVEFNELRGWGFNPIDIMRVVNDMTKYGFIDNPLKIVFARIELGLSLADTWRELSECVRISLDKLGCDYRDTIEAGNLHFLPGCERNGPKKLNAIGIDLSKYHGQNASIKIKPNELWPELWQGIEVLSMILQNPDIVKAMNGRNVPYILAPGLFVYRKNRDGSINENNRSMPCFHCLNGEKATVMLDSHKRDYRNREVTAIADYL